MPAAAMSEPASESMSQRPREAPAERQRGRAMSGRRAQAARNDELIMNAAREVFVADPTAPIAAVADRAGVGISALYRRYGSKEDMLRRLCADGLATYIRNAETALASTDPPWETFVAFARSVVAADTP